MSTEQEERDVYGEGGSENRNGMSTFSAKGNMGMELLIGAAKVKHTAILYSPLIITFPSQSNIKENNMTPNALYLHTYSS
jgi:hypothetical protein